MDQRWNFHADRELVDAVKALSLKGDLPTQIAVPQDRPELAALKSCGTEIWLDTGDRAAASGLWANQMTGLTTNNTLANQVVQTGIFDAVIADAAKKLKKAFSDITMEELIIEVGFVVNVRIARSLVAAFGSKVSVELHPSMAYDSEATVMFGKRYFDINPDYFYIKVPMTPEGLVAVRELGKKNIPVNFTLGFSARQNHLASRFANPSFVNVFLGRLNQVVKDNAIGDGDFVGEKVTLASQADLAEGRKAGKTHTRLIAASLRGGKQMITLAGVDIHTVPPKAMKEFYDLDLGAGKIEKKLGAQFKINVIGGETTGSLGLNALWDVDDGLKKTVEKLVGGNPDKMTGRELAKFLADNGQGDVFADYTPEERKKIRDTGKIPKLSMWKDRGLAIDDLMTASALESFVVDQEALDDRIRKMVAA